MDIESSALVDQKIREESVLRTLVVRPPDGVAVHCWSSRPWAVGRRWNEVWGLRISRRGSIEAARWAFWARSMRRAWESGRDVIESIVEWREAESCGMDLGLRNA